LVQETEGELETQLPTTVVEAVEVPEDQEETILPPDLVGQVEQELNYHQHLEIHFPNQMQQLVVDWDIEDLDLHHGLLQVVVVGLLQDLVPLLEVALGPLHSQQEVQFQVRQNNISLRVQGTVDQIIGLTLKMQKKTLDLAAAVEEIKVIVVATEVPESSSSLILHRTLHKLSTLLTKPQFRSYSG